MSEYPCSWGMSRGALRDDSQDDSEYSSGTMGFGSSNAFSWMWPVESFHIEPPCMFDSQDHSTKYGDPASPSSCATTPSSSELQTNRVDESSPKRRRVLVERNEKHGRKKKYDAPPGVWRNSGGFISTVYINKKRVYGPLRREVADAVRDREEMLLAKEMIHTEEAMRAFVLGMKERSSSGLSTNGNASLYSNRAALSSTSLAAVPTRSSLRSKKYSSQFEASVICGDNDDYSNSDEFNFSNEYTGGDSSIASGDEETCSSLPSVSSQNFSSFM